MCATPIRRRTSTPSAHASARRGINPISSPSTRATGASGGFDDCHVHSQGVHAVEASSSAPTNPPPITAECEAGHELVAERSRVGKCPELRARPAGRLSGSRRGAGAGCEYELVEGHVHATVGACDALDRVDLLESAC